LEGPWFPSGLKRRFDKGIQQESWVEEAIQDTQVYSTVVMDPKETGSCRE
jgi:hypothetical protein